MNREEKNAKARIRYAKHSAEVVKRTSEYKKRNPEKKRKYQQKWYAEKGKETRKRYYLKNREKERAYDSARYKKIKSTPQLIEKKRAFKRQYAAMRYAKRTKEEKLRKSARDSVRWAIAGGRLKRLPCEVCGNEKSHAHHEDYSKPLKVKWLCGDHHARVHRKYKD